MCRPTSNRSETRTARSTKRRTREVFVPLSHAPGHAQVDFGETLGVIAGVECKLHYFAMAMPHSDAFFIKTYPAETTEAFCDGHNAAFAFFGGVPLSILYDNTTIAVAKILGDGVRLRTRVFSELQSHYLFGDKFGRPGKGNDKGNVEGVIGYGRRNFLVPAPRFDSFDALNAWLEEQCLTRQGDSVRGHAETVGERLMRDLDALMALPPTPYDACDRVSTRASYGRFWLTRPDQAARVSALLAATPSVNVTPSMTIGKWFAPFRRRHVFAAA